jgi:hypothetical protein
MLVHGDDQVEAASEKFTGKSGYEQTRVLSSEGLNDM